MREYTWGNLLDHLHFLTKVEKIEVVENHSGLSWFKIFIAFAVSPYQGSPSLRP